MKYYVLLVCLVMCFFESGSSENIFDDLEDETIRVVRYRLEDEKEKRLLLQNDLDVLMLKVAKLERLLSADDKDKCSQNVAKKEQVVAFHSSYSKTHFDIVKGTTIKFDRILSNQGNGYSQNTGIFRAPVAGTYFFSLHLLASGSKTLHNGIYKNNDLLGYTYAGGTGSQSVVTDLEVGDEIFVRAYVDGSVHGGNYCSFSGFLIGI